MQNFVIFHPVNKENDVLVKLTNAYMNRLCIDEKDQNEVIELIEWEPITFDNFEHMFNSWTMRLVNFTNKLFLKKQVSLLEELGFIWAINKWTKFKRGIYGDVHFHFLVALPMSQGVTDSEYLTRILTLPIIFKSMSFQSSLTLLQGRQESLKKSPKYKLTIGDDIELLTSQLEHSTFTFYDQSKSSLVYTTVEDTLVEIECKRNSYALNNLIGIIILYSVMIFPFLLSPFVYFKIFVTFIVDDSIRDIFQFIYMSLLVWYLSRPIFLQSLTLIFAFDSFTFYEICLILFSLIVLACIFLYYVYFWMQPFSNLVDAFIDYIYLILKLYI